MDTLKINNSGNLELGGCGVASVAREHGTPVYIMDEQKIRDNCRVYMNAIKEYYKSGTGSTGGGIALYASKAFACKYIYRIAAEEGMGIDVASGGELYTADAAGFPMEKVYFHGNNKTADELKMALDNNVGRIVIDNADELVLLNTLAVQAGKKAKISIRVKPGIDAHTHDFVRTGKIDSKFGVAIETGDAEETVKFAAGLSNIEVVGVHCHIGSQIFDKEPFELAAEVMLNFIADMSDRHGIILTEVNLGGGFGIKYTGGDDPISYDAYIKAVSTVVDGVCKKRNIPKPYIVMEPGRSIVADAGLTVYTAGSVKEIGGVCKHIIVDGGMTDNPRYALYGAKYDAVIVERPTAERTEKVTVAGRSCEEGDVLIKDIMMPPVFAGDLIAVLATGAYNYSMASNYNRIPRPPVIMVKDGRAAVAVRRETYEDLVRNDM